MVEQQHKKRTISSLKWGQWKLELKLFKPNMSTL